MAVETVRDPRVGVTHGRAEEGVGGGDAQGCLLTIPGWLHMWRQIKRKTNCKNGRKFALEAKPIVKGRKFGLTMGRKLPKVSVFGFVLPSSVTFKLKSKSDCSLTSSVPERSRRRSRGQ